MQSNTEKIRAEAVKQILASWGIEGFKPDAFYIELIDRYIKGEITTMQMRELIIDNYSQATPAPSLLVSAPRSGSSIVCPKIDD